MTFEQWWKEFSKRYSLDDVDSLKTDFKSCWETSRSEGYQEGFYQCEQVNGLEHVGSA